MMQLMERHCHRLFLRSLLWLLIAALPLQGFAAVARLCCQPVTVAAVVMASAAAEPAPHCHQMPGDTAQPAPQASDHLDHQPGHDCGHAACSVGASAPPSSMLAPALLQAASMPALASNRLLAGPVPAGLERPPRTRLLP